jgi:uncharacterized repeat protein (TIGR04138 family)
MSEDLTPEIMLDSILEQDKRYSRLAYCFMMDALNYTTSRMPVRRHITGQELSMGIRNYAIQQFGIAARLVFEQWGITETRHFGDMVFNLIDGGLMRKTDEDSIADFNEVFDFESEFEVKYRILIDKTQL